MYGDFFALHANITDTGTIHNKVYKMVKNKNKLISNLVRTKRIWNNFHHVLS